MKPKRKSHEANTLHPYPHQWITYRQGNLCCAACSTRWSGATRDAVCLQAVAAEAERRRVKRQEQAA